MSVDEALYARLAAVHPPGGPSLDEATVERARQILWAITAGARGDVPLPQPVHATDGWVPGPSADAATIPIRVYRPAGTGPRPTVVYFHGGGFVGGSVDAYDAHGRQLALDVDAVVVSVGYRLAPEHVFPAAVDDCFAALTYVGRRIDEFGDDESRLAVAGDSAGGNLAAVCAQLARDAGGPVLAAQLLVYPAVDVPGRYPSRIDNAGAVPLTFRDMSWFTRVYLDLGAAGGTADEAAAPRPSFRDPRISPLHGSLPGLAPAVIATAEHDPLRDEGNAYATALADAGNRVIHRQFAHLTHAFYGLEDVSPRVADATAWLHGRLADLLA